MNLVICVCVWYIAIPLNYYDQGIFVANLQTENMSLVLEEMGIRRNGSQWKYTLFVHVSIITITRDIREGVSLVLSY